MNDDNKLILEQCKFGNCEISDTGNVVPSLRTRFKVVILRIFENAITGTNYPKNDRKF